MRGCAKEDARMRRPFLGSVSKIWAFYQVSASPLPLGHTLVPLVAPNITQLGADKGNKLTFS